MRTDISFFILWFFLLYGGLWWVLYAQNSEWPPLFSQQKETILDSPWPLEENFSSANLEEEEAVFLKKRNELNNEEINHLHAHLNEGWNEDEVPEEDTVENNDIEEDSSWKTDSSSWNEEKKNELLISEVYFDGLHEWIEIINIGEVDFNGSLSFLVNGKAFSLDGVSLGAGRVLVIGDIEKFEGFSSQNFDYQEQSLGITDTKAISITLKWWSGESDSFEVEEAIVKQLDNKKTSFERRKNMEAYEILATEEGRSRNMKTGYLANPGQAFDLLEESDTPNTWDEEDPDNEEYLTREAACNSFPPEQQNLIQISEIFQGTSAYESYIEILFKEDPINYSVLRLRGSLLKNELAFAQQDEDGDLYDYRDKNKRFLVTKSDRRYWDWMDSRYDSEFSLENTSWHLILEWRNGQIRQVLDIIVMTKTIEGKSNYYQGNATESCARNFDSIGHFSPGFDQKYLINLPINNDPKIEYIYVWGGSCWGGNSEDSREAYEEKQKFDKDLYQINIMNLVYNPPSWKKEEQELSLLLKSGSVLNLKDISLMINGKKKKIEGILKEGEIHTLIGHFWFPKSGRTKDYAEIQITYKDHIFDTYRYYFEKKEKKSDTKEALPEWVVKVFSVLDGDTFRYRKKDGKLQSVRLIGIDSPESNKKRYGKVECFGKEAKEYLTEQIKGKYVELVFDPSQDQQDIYGRLLAYAYLDGAMINEQLIEEGYAKEYTYKNPYKYQQKFKEKELSAKRQEAWMWSKNTCLEELDDKEELEIASLVEDLHIQIEGMVKNPQKKQESLLLSLEVLKGDPRFIDFWKHFFLYFFEQEGAQKEYFTQEEKNRLVLGEGIFKNLAFLGEREISESLRLDGDFGFFRQKRSCIALIYKDTIFDARCFERKKEEWEEIIKDHLEEEIQEKVPSAFSGKIAIISLLPNPRWKDAGNEAINLLYHTTEEGENPLVLDSDFSLFNGKVRKKLTGILEKGKELSLEGSFSLPNRPSCIELYYKEELLDQLCYPQPKEGIWYTKDPQLSEERIEELAFLQKIKLVKRGNQHCLVYGKELLQCKKIPLVKRKKSLSEQQLITLNSYLNKSINELENILRTDYAPLYYQDEIKDFFKKFKLEKKNIHENILSSSLLDFFSTNYEKAKQKINNYNIPFFWKVISFQFLS